MDDIVLLKVSPRKGVIRFKKMGKLGARYVGPFRIITSVGKLAYRLDLPEELSQIHKTFHILLLRKCIPDEEAVVSLDVIQVDECLNYVERPVAVLEKKVEVLQNKEVHLVEVQWEHMKGYKWAWEP